MVVRKDIIARAKEIIEAEPRAGKSRVNTMLRIEFGQGLRSSKILEIKQEVAEEKPRLYPELYARGSVPRGMSAVYQGWKSAGFLPFEARELTLGHGERYKGFDAEAIFESAPGMAARSTRLEWIRDKLDKGWSKKQIRLEIIDYYLKGRKRSPWDFIRREYRRDKKKVDFIDYREKARRRALARTKKMGQKKRRNKR